MAKAPSQYESLEITNGRRRVSTVDALGREIQKHKDHSMNIGRFWLCLPPIAMFAIDTTLTLCGQPDAYWAGDFSQAIEGSPEVRRVM